MSNLTREIKSKSFELRIYMPRVKGYSIEFSHRTEAFNSYQAIKNYFNRFGVVIQDGFYTESDYTDVYEFSIKGANQVCKALLLYMNADGFYQHKSLVPVLKELMPEVRQKDPELYNDLVDGLEILFQRNNQLATYAKDLESLRSPGKPIILSYQLQSETTNTTENATSSDFESIINADAERAKRLGFNF